MNDYFADRLGNVTIASGVVRLDFLRVNTIDDQEKKVQMGPAFRVVMPIDGMMQTIGLLDKMREQLIQQVKERLESEQNPAAQ